MDLEKKLCFLYSKAIREMNMHIFSFSLKNKPANDIDFTKFLAILDILDVTSQYNLHLNQ